MIPEALIGKGATYEIADRKLAVKDPDGRVIAAILFISDEACSAFASAALGCELETLRASDDLRINPEGQR